MSEVQEVELGESEEPKRCPRCEHWIPNDREPGVYMGAISRRYWARGPDRYTGAEICSWCGLEEAFLQQTGADLLQEVWPILVKDRTR